MVYKHSNRHRGLDSRDEKKNRKKTNRTKNGKVVFLNFEAKSPQTIRYTPFSEKVEIKLEFRLKQNEEYLFYPCDPMLKFREDLFSATVSGRNGLRIVYLTFVMRPSQPGTGSSNASFLSIIDLKEGTGTTYKVGVLNVTDDLSGTIQSQFVVSKITPHLLRYSGRKIPEIQSFIDVPLGNFWTRLPNKNNFKSNQLPEGNDVLRIKLPKTPKGEFRARNIYFDPFEGVGIALVGKNKFCQYGINYLQTKYSSIFPTEGASFTDFFYVPLRKFNDPIITHISVRAKTYGAIKTLMDGNKENSKVNEFRLNRLFGHVTTWKISENSELANRLSLLL